MGVIPKVYGETRAGLLADKIGLDTLKFLWAVVQRERIEEGILCTYRINADQKR